MPSSVQITSTRNLLVKRIRALAERDAREAEGRMVIEGVRLIEDAIAAGVPLELVMYAPKALAGPRAEAVIDQARRQGVRQITATPQVIAACSNVETSQGVVAVVERPHASLSEVLTRPDLLLVVVDRLQDPGNLGTIVRIADAAGATGVLVTRGTVDPFNPKAVRATMGSLFHLPIVVSDGTDAIAAFRSRGVRILVADPRGSIDYTDADYRAPAAIVVGSESQGPGPEWFHAAAATIRIPLYGRADSLNVAIAAGLLLYEVQRTRRPHAVP